MRAGNTKPPSLIILIAATAIGPLALNIFIPSMPGLQRAFDTNYATAQLALSLYLAGLAPAQLFYGPLSDRFGRRPVMLGGLTVFLFGSLLCLFAPAIEFLIAGRIVQAVGGCVGMVVGRAVVRDLYDRDRTASILAYITMAMVTAPMVAPMIGGFLDVWFGWRASFVFVLVAGGCVLTGVWILLSETHAGDEGHSGWRDLLASFPVLIRRRAFCGYAFQVSFSSATFFAFLGGAPYVTVELMGRTPSDYGVFFVPIVAMYMLGNFLSARGAVRIGIDRMITTGTLISLAGAVSLAGVALAGALSPYTMFGLMAVMALGNGLCIANGFAGAVSVEPQIAGAAAGFSGFLHTATGAAASFVVGSLLTDSATPLIIAMVAGAVLGLTAHAVGILAGRQGSNA